VSSGRENIQFTRMKRRVVPFTRYLDRKDINAAEEDEVRRSTFWFVLQSSPMRAVFPPAPLTVRCNHLFYYWLGRIQEQN